MSLTLKYESSIRFSLILTSYVESRLVFNQVNLSSFREALKKSYFQYFTHPGHWLNWGFWIEIVKPCHFANFNISLINVIVLTIIMPLGSCTIMHTLLCIILYACTGNIKKKSFKNLFWTCRSYYQHVYRRGDWSPESCYSHCKLSLYVD